MHKLIYTFQDQLQLLVDDVKDAVGDKKKVVTGRANVSDLFNVTSTRGGKKHNVVVAGSAVKFGQIEAKLKFRLLRND